MRFIEWIKNELPWLIDSKVAGKYGMSDYSAYDWDIAVEKAIKEIVEENLTEFKIDRQNDMQSIADKIDEAISNKGMSDYFGDCTGANWSDEVRKIINEL